MKTAQTMAQGRPIHKVWGTTNTDRSQQPQQKGEMWMEKGSELFTEGGEARGGGKRLEKKRAGRWTQGISERQNRRERDVRYIYIHKKKQKKQYPLHWKTTEGKRALFCDDSRVLVLPTFWGIGMRDFYKGKKSREEKKKYVLKCEAKI